MNAEQSLWDLVPENVFQAFLKRLELVELLLEPSIDSETKPEERHRYCQEQRVGERTIRDYLYHACGFYPEGGDEVLPSNLVELRVQVKVEQVEGHGRIRLRILSYQPTCPPVLDSPLAARRQEAADG